MPLNEADSRILDPCPNCTTLLDVTDAEPYTEVHCPICGTKMRVRKQFNNFALQRVLGEGGMGTVFEAIDVNLQRPVAVKILKKEFSAEEESIAKLETEARITASINHPHVVKVFSAGRDHGQFYLAMELVGKGTLDNLMNLQGRVAEAQVLDVGIQVADGLRSAMQKGLIHRDVKPGNILFADAHTAKVVDFGLAILMEDEAKSRGEIWGTPYYVAPEKLNNEAEDFRSDIYSLGGTLFHAVSGRPPFEAASASLVALKHLKSQAVSLQAFAPDVSNETAYVINRMLHKDPLERYQSYDELIEHLRYARTQLQERATGVAKPKQRVIVESEQTRSFTAGVSVALILLTLGIGGFVYTRRATIFGSSDAPPAKVEKAAPETGGEIDSEYEEAQATLAKGQADDAEAMFDKVIASGVPQPRLNWARVQKGMALLLSGKQSDASSVFSEIQKEGLYSDDPRGLRLANFFLECGRLMNSSTAIPGETTRVYGNKDFEGMGLLLFGLKDWMAGYIKDAGPMLEKFAAASPEPDYQWISSYKPLTEKYLKDYQIYKSLAEAIAAAQTPEQKAEALKAVKAAGKKIGTAGSMPDQLRKWESSIAADLASQQKKQVEVKAAIVQIDTTRETAEWQKLSTAGNEALRNFAPENVLAKVGSAKFADPSLAKKRETLQKRVDLLGEFKTRVIAAVNTARYTGPAINRRGSTIPGKAARADNNLVHVKSAYGEIPIPWKDVNPATIQDIAAKLTTDSDASHKQWLAGVYETLCGDAAKGRQMLLDASQNNEKLRDELAVFFDEAK